MPMAMFLPTKVVSQPDALYTSSVRAMQEAHAPEALVQPICKLS